MNITAVKAAIPAWAKAGIIQFHKSTSKPDSDGVITEWANGWIDSERVRISFPMPVFDAIKANPDAVNTLNIKTEDRISKSEGNKPYIQHIVYSFKPGDAGEL